MKKFIYYFGNISKLGYYFILVIILFFIGSCKQEITEQVVKEQPV